MPPPAFAETVDDPTFAAITPLLDTDAVIGCELTVAVI
jgi:hypothetical protein